LDGLFDWLQTVTPLLATGQMKLDPERSSGSFSLGLVGSVHPCKGDQRTEKRNGSKGRRKKVIQVERDVHDSHGVVCICLVQAANIRWRKGWWGHGRYFNVESTGSACDGVLKGRGVVSMLYCTPLHSCIRERNAAPEKTTEVFAPEHSNGNR